ncbi:DUF6287 domain-containing protein [Pediococcus ethanolidurans]
MNREKVMNLIFAIMAMVMLAACKNQNQKQSSSKTATTTSRSKSNTSKKKSSNRSKKVAQSSSSVKKNFSESTTMNFEQIKQGDYSGLQGTWTELAHKTGKTFVKGGTDTLSVLNESMVNGPTKVQKQTLTDIDGEHALVFKTKDNILTASLSDENVAVNWTVKFYPKGTTSQYQTNDNAGKNSQNLIVIWTSNNSYTEVFAQTSTKVPVVKAKTVKTGLNLSQISKNNFSSLVGTWKNNHDGKAIVVTSKTMNKPSDSNVAWSKGAVLSGAEHNGYPRVITAGEITDGYIQGGIGTFDPNALGSSFDPLTIIPKNVKLSNSDDSDYTRDRLILGGGQGGTGTQAYYKQ